MNSLDLNNIDCLISKDGTRFVKENAGRNQNFQNACPE